MALLASTSIFAQNLVLDGSCDEWTVNTGDNADAFDMTPNSTIQDNSGATVDSPYRALWYNSALETFLSDTYHAGGSVNEQPGSSSDGTWDGATKTRSVKLYGDGTTTQSTRRLYQKVAVEAGQVYTFSVDSRSAETGTPSEIFMLNEEISTEIGLENGLADPRVDAYVQVTTDYNPSSGAAGEASTFTNTSFEFTASGSFVVIYVRSLNATTSSAQVYFDNLSLVKNSTASVKDDEFSTYFSLYPNPASTFINIQSKSVEVTKAQIYNLTGQLVLDQDGLNKSGIDVSNLAKGIYILKLSSADNQYSRKIVIE
jgi:hypothetical protein